MARTPRRDPLASRHAELSRRRVIGASVYRDGCAADRDPSTIFVIDDDPDFLLFARAVLEGGAYRVETRAVGADAVAVIRALHPALVILDLCLGDRAGEDVFQVIALDPCTETSPCSSALRLRSIFTA
jgi:CheY-like chemotaxis protein